MSRRVGGAADPDRRLRALAHATLSHPLCIVRRREGGSGDAQRELGRIIFGAARSDQRPVRGIDSGRELGQKNTRRSARGRSQREWLSDGGEARRQGGADGGARATSRAAGAANGESTQGYPVGAGSGSTKISLTCQVGDGVVVRQRPTIPSSAGFHCTKLRHGHSSRRGPRAAASLSINIASTRSPGTPRRPPSRSASTTRKRAL